MDWDAWIARSPLAAITPAAVSQALDGFPLEPRQGVEWLARAIQGALLFHFPFISAMNNDHGECCVITVPNATEAKRIYGQLSKAADDLFAGILRNSELLAYSLTTPERYAEIHDQVEQIATLFAEAATNTAKLQPRWRQKRAREERITIAATLAPVFELAFERTPAVDSWPDSDGGPWPDFCRRILSLALGEQKTLDYWRDVAKQARRMDCLNRVTFAPGQLAEYTP